MYKIGASVSFTNFTFTLHSVSLILFRLLLLLVLSLLFLHFLSKLRYAWKIYLCKWSSSEPGERRIFGMEFHKAKLCDEIKDNKWHNFQKWQKHTHILHRKQRINYHYSMFTRSDRSKSNSSNVHAFKHTKATHNIQIQNKRNNTITSHCVRRQIACKALHKIEPNEIRELEENPFSIFWRLYALLMFLHDKEMFNRQSGIQKSARQNIEKKRERQREKKGTHEKELRWRQ